MPRRRNTAEATAEPTPETVVEDAEAIARAEAEAAAAAELAAQELAAAAEREAANALRGEEIAAQVRDLPADFARSLLKSLVAEIGVAAAEAKRVAPGAGGDKGSAILQSLADHPDWKVAQHAIACDCTQGRVYEVRRAVARGSAELPQPSGATAVADEVAPDAA